MCLLLVGLAACATDPDEPVCQARVLRVTSVEIPATLARARELAFDLDRDQTTDNAAGLAAATVHDHAPIFAPSEIASTRLAGDVPWTLEVLQCDDDTATLAGARMPVSLLVDAAGTVAEPGFVTATHSAITLARDADGAWRGRVGMAFEQSQLIEAVIVPLAPFFDEHQLFLEYFDAAPHDGRISVDELRRSSILRFLLLAPDVAQTDTAFAIAFTARE